VPERAPGFMNRKDLYFLAVAAGIIALFTVLWIISRKPPAMTARAEHAGITRNTPRETCWACHTPDSKVWVRHPKKGKPPDITTPCYACHKFPEAQVADASHHRSRDREVDLIWPDPQPR
jgi:hypothetical protein